jgi:hypothetical protein
VKLKVRLCAINSGTLAQIPIAVKRMLERRELRWHTCGRKRITPFDVLVVGAFVSAWLTAVEELKVIEATTPS